MKSIYEKIAEFLGEQNSPVSVADFMADMRFSALKREELLEILLDESREGKVHYSLREGKAYFSGTPLEDEVTNPARSFISNMKTNLASVLAASQVNNGASAKVQGAAPQGIFNQVFEGVKEIGTQKEVPHFTYKEGKRCGDERYSIAIPDGFRIQKNVDDRAFVAWLPNEDEPDQYESGKVILFDGTFQQINMDEMPVLPEQMMAISEMVSWKSQSTMNSLFKTEIFSVWNGEVGGTIRLNGTHAYIQLGFPDGIKIIRIQIDGEFGAGQYAAYANMAREWVSTLHLKKGFSEILALDGAKFMQPILSAELVKLFKDEAEKWTQNLQKLFDLKMGALQAQVEYRQENGNISASALRQMIKDQHDDIRERYETVAQQAVSTLKHFSDIAPQNELLLDLYAAAEPVFEQDKWENAVDGKPIVTQSEKILTLRKAALTPAIAALQTKFSDRFEKLKHEKEKEKAEKDREQPAENLKSEADKLFEDYEKEKNRISEQRKRELDQVYARNRSTTYENMNALRREFTLKNNESGRRLSALVRKLSEDGEKLVKRGAGEDFIRRMISKIQEEQEELTLELDINISAYDKWEIRFDIPQDIKKLPDKWKKMLNQPSQGKNELQKKQKASEAKPAKEKEKTKQAETEDEKYQKAYHTWKKECDEATAKRKARKEKLLEEAEAENRKQLERAEQAYRQSITQKKQHLEDEKRRKEEAEKKLGTLGFFAFGEKKDQKAIIEETTRTIPQTQAAIEQAEADYQAELGKIAERLKKNKEEAESKAEREIPMPEKPLSPEESRRQKQEADWKNRIQAALSYSREVSIEDIRNSDPELAKLPSYQIRRLLTDLKRELEPEGITVQRMMVNRKECYVLN